MRNFFELLREYMVPIITIGVGLIVTAGILIPTLSWSQSVTVEPVTARVLTVGAGQSVTYQCGSTKVGEVSIPTYCTRIEYPVEYVVAGTDATFTHQGSNSPAVGSETQAYKVIDGNSYSYGLEDPSSVGFTILMVFLSLLGGVFAGFIAFFITDHFTY